MDQLVSVAGTPTLDRLAVVDSGLNARLVDAASGRTLLPLASALGDTYVVSFDPTGRRLYTGHARGIGVWESDDWQTTRTAYENARRAAAQQAVRQCDTLPAVPVAPPRATSPLPRPAPPTASTTPATPAAPVPLAPAAALERQWRPVFAKSGVAGTLTLLPDNTYALALPPVTTSLEPLRALHDLPLSRLELVSAQVTDLTPLTGLRLRYLDLSMTPVASLEPLRGMPLEALYLVYCKQVTDLAPLAGMPLRDLNLEVTGVRDLTPLTGMPLTRISFASSPVSDLTPLAQCPLTTLSLGDTLVSDFSLLPKWNLVMFMAGSTSFNELSLLSPKAIRNLAITVHPGLDWALLQKLPLASLKLDGCRDEDLPMVRPALCNNLELSGDQITTLAPLAGMRLKRLRLYHVAVTDLRPLAGMPLESLEIQAGLPLTDLTPLAGLPLINLNLDSQHVASLAPLATCKTLRNIKLPPDPPDLAPLRQLPVLGTINGQPAATFWAAYEQQHPAP